MFVQVYSEEGEDLGFLNLSALEEFKIGITEEADGEYFISTKKGTTIKTWIIGANTFNAIMEALNRNLL